MGGLPLVNLQALFDFLQAALNFLSFTACPHTLGKAILRSP